MKTQRIKSPYKLIWILAAAAWLLVVPVGALAQTDAGAGSGAGSISGTVTDGSGAPLPGVAVTARNTSNEFSRATLTDEAGHYTLRLPAGSYEVSAEIDGFNEEQSSVALSAGQEATSDFSLTVGTLVEQITVTASKGLETRAAEVPQVVTVITAEDIQDRNLQSVAEAVERAPNVRTIDQNPTRARPQLRGLASSRVLILVDGERLNNVRFDAGATGVSPSMVDVTQVETIEVLGGAGSGVYGTDAMAGVINIVTKQPKAAAGNSQLDLLFDATYNENSGYQKGVITADYSGQNWAWRTIYSNFELDGWEAGDDGVTRDQVLEAASFAQEVAVATGSDITNSFAIWEFAEGERVPNSQGEGFNFQTDLWFFPTDRQSLRIKYLTSQHENLGLPFSTPPTDPTTRFNTFRDLDKLVLDYELFDLTDTVSSLSFRVYRQNFERPQDDNRFNIDPFSSYDPNTSTFTGGLSTFTRGREQSTLNDVTTTGVEVKANLELGSRAILTTGAYWSNDESEDSFSFESFDATGQNVFYSETNVATTPDTEYENTALFAALDWRPADWVRISGGLRWDEWKTEAKPSDRYPPVQENFIVQTALPLLAANPGDLVLEGINGLDDFLSGQSGIETKNDVVTGNLGVTFFTDLGINPYIRWAESYREPEVTVRYLIRNFGSPFFFVTGLPNSTLEPEEGETLDLGIKLDRRNWRGQLGYFENDIQNFIGSTLSDTVFSFNFIRPDLGLLSPVGLFFQRINLGEVSFSGWEASLEGSIALSNGGALSPYFTLSHLDSENKSPTQDDLTTIALFYNRNDTPRRFEGSADDVPFGSTIEDQGLFGLRYTAPGNRWFVEYELKWVGDIDRVAPGDLSSVNTTQFGSFSSLEGYERHSLRGGYRFQGTIPVRLNVAIENLTDKFYFDPFQLAPAPGRSIIAGVSIPWNNVFGN